MGMLHAVHVRSTWHAENPHTVSHVQGLHAKSAGCLPVSHTARHGHISHELLTCGFILVTCDLHRVAM